MAACMPSRMRRCACNGKPAAASAHYLPGARSSAPLLLALDRCRSGPSHPIPASFPALSRSCTSWLVTAHGSWLALSGGLGWAHARGPAAAPAPSVMQCPIAAPRTRCQTLPVSLLHSLPPITAMRQRPRPSASACPCSRTGQPAAALKRLQPWRVVADCAITNTIAASTQWLPLLHAPLGSCISCYSSTCTLSRLVAGRA